MRSNPFLSISLLFFASATAMAAAVPVQNCAAAFQSKFRELLAIKQSCPSIFLENCCQIKQLTSTTNSGIYTISDQQRPFTSDSHIEARCDMETDGGGWLVIQRRLPNGTVNFTRDWSDYENGFGDLNGEFWYGLRNIHALTSRDDVELRIDMVMEDDDSELSWTYQTFRVAGASDKYRLTIGGGVGTHGSDAMEYHNGQMFSTYDNDNDASSSNCPFKEQAGWWYKECFHASLNGPHTRPSTPGISTTYARLIWNDGSTYRDVSSVEMKIRVKPCNNIMVTEDTTC